MNAFIYFAMIYLTYTIQKKIYLSFFFFINFNLEEQKHPST